MVSTFAFFALALPANVTLDWQTDYAQAIKLAESHKKPLAVFISKGKNGWDAVTSEGHLNGQALQTLRENYVCLYVDAGEQSGKESAALFQAGEKPTLIVSDRTLVYQAYRASGPISNDQLAQVFKRFANHEGPAPVEPEVRRSYYQPAGGTTTIPCRG